MKKEDLLLVGVGRMGIEYARVFAAMNMPFTPVGRGEASAAVFRNTTGLTPHTGGLERYLSALRRPPEMAVAAVNVTELSRACVLLAEAGVRKILVEKPGMLTTAEAGAMLSAAAATGAEVYIAYNRRFMATVHEARRLLEAGGGVRSFHFEFTEWSDRVALFDADPAEKEHWLLANSSHVADLAFFLGGRPASLSAFHAGSLPWHHAAAAYSGAGISTGGAPFSYCANWDAPGRWSVELMTRDIRVILRPLEELSIQRRGSLTTEKVEVDDAYDRELKPGLRRMVEQFTGGGGGDLCTLTQQALMLPLYRQMANYS